MAGTLPPAVSQAMLQQFVTKYRLQRAVLGGVTFFMNPDITKTNQWLISMQPTGSGYVRWTFGAQPYTIRLDGTTGVMGYDSGQDAVGGTKQLMKKFAPGWDTMGLDNQGKTFSFSFPALGINIRADSRGSGVYVDSFTVSITSQHPLYTFYTMQLTILPPRVAKDYQPYTPLPQQYIALVSNNGSNSLIAPG